MGQLSHACCAAPYCEHAVSHRTRLTWTRILWVHAGEDPAAAAAAEPAALEGPAATAVEGAAGSEPAVSKRGRRKDVAATTASPKQAPTDTDATAVQEAAPSDVKKDN